MLLWYPDDRQNNASEHRGSLWREESELVVLIPESVCLSVCVYMPLKINEHTHMCKYEYVYRYIYV